MDNVNSGRDGEDNINGDIEREAELERQRQEIFQRWVEKKSPDQIAKETGLWVGIVYDQLKQIQKGWVIEKGG